RVAAELPDIPRQVLARIAALDDAVLPAHLQHLGRDAGRARVRVRAEVADAGVDVQLAVRRDPDDAVETRESGRMKALPDRDGSDLRAVALAAAGLALGVVELRCTLLERFADVGARDRRPLAAEPPVHAGCVDPADVERVETELARGFVHQRLDDRDGLVVPRPALGGPRHGVRQHVDAAETHRLRLIEHRNGFARGRPVREALRRAVLLYDVHVDGRDPPVRLEA